MNINMKQILSPAQALAAREELRLSQAKVASEVGISRPYLSQFEGGKRILSDSDQEELLGFFMSQGWVCPQDDSEEDQPEEDEDVLPYVLCDGFVIPESIDMEMREELMDEYWSNADRIEELRETTVKRNFLGNIREYRADTIVIEVLLLTSRQDSIKKMLHGHMETSGEFVELNYGSIENIGQYIDKLFYKFMVKNERFSLC